jgi:hypothetical protein
MGLHLTADFLVKGGCRSGFDGGQKFRRGVCVMAERRSHLQRRRKVHADGDHLAEAQLPAAPKGQIPRLPAFKTLRFMLPIRTKLAFGVGFAAGTGKTRFRASGAIIRPAAKMPAATSRQTFFSCSSNKAGPR